MKISCTLLAVLPLFAFGCAAKQTALTPSVLSHTDMEVLKAVVEDWNRSPESVCIRNETNLMIVLHSSVSDASSATQIHADLQDEHELPQDLILAFVRRNTTPVDLPAGFSADAPAIVANVESRAIYSHRYRFPDLYPEAKSFMHLSLPAYGNPKDTALVRFEFGPTHHGAMCTYFLKQVNGRWTVAWKKTAYYA